LSRELKISFYSATFIYNSFVLINILFKRKGQIENDEMWKEVVVAKFKALSRHLAGGTEENNNKPQDSQCVS
jgi:hypothetical protein